MFFQNVFSFVMSRFKKSRLESEEKIQVEDKDKPDFVDEESHPVKVKGFLLESISSIDVTLTTDNSRSTFLKTLSMDLSFSRSILMPPEKRAIIYKANAEKDSLGLLSMLNNEIRCSYGEGFLVLKDVKEQKEEMENFFMSEIIEVINDYVFSAYKCVSLDQINKTKENMVTFVSETNSGKKVFHLSVSKGALSYVVIFNVKE